MSAYPPHFAYPSAPPLQRAMPKPPRLHWGWVLALTILTVGLFASVWLVVQSLWVKRMRGGKSAGFTLALCNLVWIGVVFVAGFALGMLNALAPSALSSGLLAAFQPFVRISSLALFLTAIFTLRREMEEAPIEIPLSGVATFFLAVVYFEYNLQSYGLPGQTYGTSIISPAASAPSIGGEEIRYPTAAEVGVTLPQRPVPREERGRDEIATGTLARANEPSR